MKTMILEDRLYSALEEEADRSGRTVDELVTEATETWLADLEPDEGERPEIELARSEAAVLR